MLDEPAVVGLVDSSTFGSVVDTVTDTPPGSAGAPSVTAVATCRSLPAVRFGIDNAGLSTVAVISRKVDGVENPGAPRTVSVAVPPLSGWNAVVPLPVEGV